MKRDEIRGYALISAAVEIGLPRGDRDAAVYELGALSQRLSARQLERAQADTRALMDTRSKESTIGPVSARNEYRL